MKKRRVHSWWLLAAAALLIALGQQASGASGAARIGSPAPDFTLQLLDGKSISLSSLKGKPIVMNFWHSG